MYEFLNKLKRSQRFIVLTSRSFYLHSSRKKPKLRQCCTPWYKMFNIHGNQFSVLFKIHGHNGFPFETSVSCPFTIIYMAMSSSSWDCVTSFLGDWGRQHSDLCMERLVKSNIVRLTMAQMAIHEAKKVLRSDIKKRVAVMTNEAKLKESTSIVSKVSLESSIFRTFR